MTIINEKNYITVVVFQNYYFFSSFTISNRNWWQNEFRHKLKIFFNFSKTEGSRFGQI